MVGVVWVCGGALDVCCCGGVWCVGCGLGLMGWLVDGVCCVCLRRRVGCVLDDVIDDRLVGCVLDMMGWVVDGGCCVGLRRRVGCVLLWWCVVCWLWVGFDGLVG